jgi:hypothetical protein
MPSLASWNQAGTGWPLSDSWVGRYWVFLVPPQAKAARLRTRQAEKTEAHRMKILRFMVSPGDCIIFSRLCKNFYR